MTAPEFVPWGKIARLNRPIVVTEKIDGTNAAIHITEEGTYAQSRTRLITIEKDNFGFARWVADNESELRDDLGPGLHFGEWYGLGIQRAYGLDHKRFALFNAFRFTATAPHFVTPNLGVVPILYEGPFTTDAIDGTLRHLFESGSWVAPGFTRPEGIVIFHKASGQMFKVTVENDEQSKGSLEAEARRG